MQAPSCERHKTAQRTLFLLFATNNCFPTSDEKLLALFEFCWFFWNQRGGGQQSLVMCGIASFFKDWRMFKAASPINTMTLKKLQRCYQYRWSTFAETPNVALICCVIWKDFWWRADYYRHFKYRGGCTLFQGSVWCEKCVEARHYTVIWKKILFANNRNRIRWVVLGLSQGGACTVLFENLTENSLKGGLSNDNTDNSPLFSLVTTFEQFIQVVKTIQQFEHFRRLANNISGTWFQNSLPTASQSSQLALTFIWQQGSVDIFFVHETERWEHAQVKN